MVRLRYRWIWLLLGWALVLLVTSASLTPGVELPRVSFADKLAHAGAYFLLMIWFAGLYARGRHVFVAAGLLALGATLEVIQGQLPYRMFDPLDMLANASGVAIGFGLSFWLLAGWCQRIERRLGYHE